MKLRITIEPVAVLGNHVHMGVRVNGALSGTLVARVGEEADELSRVLLQLHCGRDPASCDLNEETAKVLHQVVEALGCAQDLVEGADLVDIARDLKSEANNRGDGWAKVHEREQLLERLAEQIRGALNDTEPEERG